jgi:superfamily II RNA helicase
VKGVLALDPQQLFPFPLDDFQLAAIETLNEGKSVVVCAPTGSGKTLVAEYAIHAALANHKRVFYTTPLKALSNQKLRDFREQFGADQVGLLTGDISINRDAPILVMTTEIFRNMLYGTPIGEVGTSMVDVAVVVLDECHYMNDRQRGTVWEESIIYCPAEVQLLALSATVANGEELTDWIATVHGDTNLIYSDFRPVPLRFFFCNSKGMFPLLEPSGKKINNKLKPKTNQPRNREERQKNCAPLLTVISHLQEREMLPAIYFIFSRRGCDQAASELGRVSLVTPAEAASLKTQIDAFVAANPELMVSKQLEGLYRGIAAHHAGILPAWKGLIEELFQQGLIKVVFATETLAAGVNMPARTTVISSLSKRTDQGHRLLKASEFLQMSGRAGRRGKDVVGYVVTLESPYEGAKEAAHLATSQPDPLVSQFAPSYGMVMNLLQTHSLEEARQLVERSFGQYLANLSLQPQIDNLESVAEQLAQLEIDLAGVDLSLWESYEKLRERLREERRLLKLLEQQAEDMRLSDVARHAPYLLTGTPLTLRLNKNLLAAAVLVQKISGSGQFPWFVCLTAKNHWHVVSHKDIWLIGTAPMAEFEQLVERLSEQLGADSEPLYPAPLPLRLNGDYPGEETTRAIAQAIPVLPLPVAPPEVQEQSERTNSLEQQMNDHPVAQWTNRSVIAKKLNRQEQLQRQLEFQRGVVEKRQQRNWREFMSLVEILQAYECLAPVAGTDPVVLQSTPAGEAVAALRGDNELWLALALLSGELENLQPHHLATVCAALTIDNNRSDTRINFGISPTVEEALSALSSIGYKLSKLQKRYFVDIPILLDYELAALVEQWATEMEWAELCSNTSLDEGDIVRIIRRTLDILAQIIHVPNLSKNIYESASTAIRLIDRFPVSELI